MNYDFEAPKIDSDENDVSDILSPPVSTNQNIVSTQNNVIPQNTQAITNTISESTEIKSSIENNEIVPQQNDQPISYYKNDDLTADEKKIIKEFNSDSQSESIKTNNILRLVISILNILFVFPEVSRIIMAISFAGLLAGSKAITIIALIVCVCYYIFSIVF